MRYGGRMADPFADAVAEQLPAVDEASPKARRLAAGVALLRQGKTYREASELCGVPRSSLWEFAHGLHSEVGRNEALDTIERQIENLSAEIVVRASQKLLERLDDDSMRPSEEVKALQVARDTLSIRRKWNGASIGDARAVNALADALEAMRDRAQADAKVAEAIEVEPGE